MGISRMCVLAAPPGLAGVIAMSLLACSQEPDEPEYPWHQARSMVGEDVRICGPLAGLRETDEATFLNLGEDYPSADRFTIVVWNGGVEVPKDAFGICAKGEVSLYDEVAQIELSHADGLEFMQPTSDPYVDDPPGMP